MNIDELLKILACPACHSPLVLEERADKKQGFLCERCQLLYPIENEIPVMLIEKAIPINAWRQEGLDQ